MKSFLRKAGKIVAFIMAFAMVATSVPEIGAVRVAEAADAMSVTVLDNNLKPEGFTDLTPSGKGLYSKTNDNVDFSTTFSNSGSSSADKAGVTDKYYRIPANSAESETVVDSTKALTINAKKAITVVINAWVDSTSNIKFYVGEEGKEDSLTTIYEGTSNTKKLKQYKFDLESGKTYQFYALKDMNITYIGYALAVTKDVVFKNNDGTTASTTVSVLSGKKVSTPKTNPTRDGYRFKDWYTTAECTAKFDFNTAITADTDIYAGWDKEYAITWDTPENGTITASTGSAIAGNTAIKGEDVTITGTPAEGYVLDSITVTDLGEIAAAGNIATFKMPEKDVVVTPNFITKEAYIAKAPKWDITIATDSSINAIVKLSTDSAIAGDTSLSQVMTGEKVYVTVTPDAAYQCTKVEYQREAAAEAVAIEAEEGVYSFVAPATESADDGHMNIAVNVSTKKKPTVTAAAGKESVLSFSKSYGLKEETVEVTVTVPEGKVLKGLTYKVGDTAAKALNKTGDKYIITIPNNDDDIIVDAVLVDTQISLNIKDVDTTGLNLETASKEVNPCVTLVKGPSAGVSAAAMGDNSEDYPTRFNTGGYPQSSKKGRALKLDLPQKANVRLILSQNACADGPFTMEIAKGAIANDELAGPVTGATKYTIAPATSLFKDKRGSSKQACSQLGVQPVDVTLDAGVYYLYGTKSSVNFYAVDIDFDVVAEVANYATINYHYNDAANTVVTNNYVAEGKTTVNPGNLSKKYVDLGSTAVATENKTDDIKDGYVFTKWYKDEACTIEWDFAADTVSGTVDIYAGWKEAVADIEIEDNADATITFVSGVTEAEGKTTAVANNTVKVKAIVTTAKKAVKSIVITDSVKTVSGSAVTGEADTYAVKMLANNSVIKVNVANTYDVNVEEASGCSISVKNDITSRFDDDAVEVTVAPEAGYYVKSIKVNDVVKQTYDAVADEAKGANKVLNIEDLGAADATITAVCEKIDYTLTKDEKNTTITLGATKAQMGDTVNFSVAVDAGYELSAVKVNGTDIAITEDNNYSFVMENKATTISAYAGKIQALTVAIASGTTVKVYGADYESGSAITVVGGKTVVLDITVPDGFRIASGVSITATSGAITVAEKTETKNQYKFTMPDEDAAVSYEIEVIPEFDVAFNLNGHGTAIDSQKVRDGENATKPADPTEEGYIFKGWTLNGEAYDFNSAVTGNITLKASWVRDLSTYTEVKPITADVYGDETIVNITAGSGLTEKTATAGNGYETFLQGSDKQGVTFKAISDVDIFVAIETAASKALIVKKNGVDSKETAYAKDGELVNREFSLKAGDTLNISYGTQANVKFYYIGYKLVGTAHEHTYGAWTFTWAADYSTASATKTCSNTTCGKKVTEEAVVTSEVTKAATKEEAGNTAYTATLSDNTKEVKNVPIAKLHSHTYGTWTFTWAADFSSATATRTCTTAGCVEEGNTQTETATVTSEVKDKQKVYTATLADGTKEIKTVDMDPEKHTHAYGEWSEINWSKDYRTASRTKVCGTCDATVKDHAVTETVAAAITRTEATTEAEGKVVYTVTFADGTKDSKTVTIDKLVPGQAHDEVDEPVADPDDADAVGYVYSYKKTHYYTGVAITPAVTIYYNNQELVEGKDYKVAYKNNVKVASAADGKKAPVIKITGLGNFAGNYENLTFNIVALETKSDASATDISKFKVEGIAKSYAYTGSEIKPEDLKLVDKKTNTSIVVSGASIDVVYAANVNKGTASICFVGKNEYTGSVTAKFKIDCADITACDVDIDESAAYQVAGAKPEITITNKNGDELVEGKDYTVKYTAKYGKPGVATITGKGNYKGKITKNFTVAQANIADCDIVVVPVSVGTKASKVAVLVFDENGSLLKAKADYTLSTTARKDTVNEDGDTVTITGAGAFAGSTEEAIPVVTGGVAIKAKATKTSGKIYNGEEQTLKDTDLDVTAGGQPIQADDENGYEVVGYSNNINKGTATAYVVGTGKVTGYSKVTFKIVSKLLIKK